MKNRVIAHILKEARDQLAYIHCAYGENIPDGYARDAYEWAQNMQRVCMSFAGYTDQTNEGLYRLASKCAEAGQDFAVIKCIEYIKGDLLANFDWDD